MPSWGATARLGIRSRGREEAIAREAVQRLSIRTASTSTPAAALSGGNQQKLVIGKWIARRPKLLVLDEPTRGVDVGAKAELYKLIDELAAAGMGVLVASSELLELMRLCDRILVMAGGRIVGEQTGAEATEESITHLAFTGLHDTNEVEG
jgi:ABC-type sugar transport system ATPase subunit